MWLHHIYVNLQYGPPIGAILGNTTPWPAFTEVSLVVAANVGVVLFIYLISIFSLNLFINNYLFDIYLTLFSSGWGRPQWVSKCISYISVCSFDLFVPFIWRPLHFLVFPLFIPIFMLFDTNFELFFFLSFQLEWIFKFIDKGWMSFWQKYNFGSQCL